MLSVKAQKPAPPVENQMPAGPAVTAAMADIIKYLPDATLVINLQGAVIAWNQAIEEMTGVRASDMLGRGNFEYAMPFYGYRRPILIDLVLRPDIDTEKNYFFIERNKEALIAETPTPSVRGQEAFLWGKASLLYNEQGEVIGAIESIRDVTERKQAEVALKNSEQRLADIINFLPDPTLAIDTQHRVIAWNRAIEKMSGVSAADMLGQGDYAYAVPFHGQRRPILIDLLLQPDPLIERDYVNLKRDEYGMVVESHAIRLRGREAFLWAKASLLYDSQGQVVGAIESMRDITERQRAVKENMEARERVARAENLASLGLMTTGLAHAIKQPLNSLMITIDSILYWNDRGQEMKWDSLIEDLQKMFILAGRIDEIIEKMRGLIRNEQYSQLAPCDLNHSVAGALDILQAQFLSNHIDLICCLEDGLPQVLGSESLLEEVAINLIGNAIQALEKAPAELRLIKCATRLEENVVLEISDTGPGIEAELQGRIFEPLFSTKSDQGMGMGLFIARSIITGMNGCISCQSGEGRTVFRVELPPINAGHGRTD